MKLRDDFSNLCLSFNETIKFPFVKKNKTHFQETKVNFLSKVFFY